MELLYNKSYEFDIQSFDNVTSIQEVRKITQGDIKDPRSTSEVNINEELLKLENRFNLLLSDKQQKGYMLGF